MLSTAPGRFPRSRYLSFFAVTIGGCAVDLATKSWIFAEARLAGPAEPALYLWRDVFRLTTSLNEGPCSDSAKGSSLAFAMLSLRCRVFRAYWLFFAARPAMECSPSRSG